MTRDGSGGIGKSDSAPLSAVCLSLGNPAHDATRNGCTLFAAPANLLSIANAWVLRQPVDDLCVNAR